VILLLREENCARVERVCQTSLETKERIKGLKYTEREKKCLIADSARYSQQRTRRSFLSNGFWDLREIIKN